MVIICWPCEPWDSLEHQTIYDNHMIIYRIVIVVSNPTRLDNCNVWQNPQASFWSTCQRTQNEGIRHIAHVYAHAVLLRFTQAQSTFFCTALCRLASEKHARTTRSGVHLVLFFWILLVWQVALVVQKCPPWPSVEYVSLHVLHCIHTCIYSLAGNPFTSVWVC